MTTTMTTMMNNLSLPDTFVLRDYQEDALKELRFHYDHGLRRVMVPMATGLGKTVCFTFLPEYFPELFERGMLVLVHREELVQQAVNKLQAVHRWVPVQIEQASNHADAEASIVVASVQTLGRKGSNRINKFEDRFGIVVVDEAHHITKGSQYDTVLETFGLATSSPVDGHEDPDRLLVGVTATPNRHDGQGFTRWFDELATNYDLRWGVENGWLTDIRGVKIDTETDISEVPTRMGDFAVNKLDEAVNTYLRNDVIVKGYRDHGGNCAIAFCTSIQHAVDLADVFRRYGYNAECVHSKMDPEERRWHIHAFREGRVEVLTNVGIATEGFDVPRIDTLLMARPTKSTLLYQQCIGRGTRPLIDLSGYEDQEERVEAIRSSIKPHMMVVDFTDNSGHHELVTLPTLFGLTKRFDYKKKSAIVTEQIIEGLEQIHPTKDLRIAADLDDLRLKAETVSLWDIAKSTERGEGLSRLTWMYMQNGSAQLVIPGHLCEEKKRSLIVKVIPDRLGRYSVEAHYPGYYDRNAGYHISSKTEKSHVVYKSKEDAISGVDKWARKKYLDIINLITRGQRWRSAPATDKQRYLIMKLYKQQPPDGLTKGEAAALINRATVENP